MDMVVGNRRAPGATILGSVLEYLICQPSFVVFRRRVLYFVEDNPVDSVTTAFRFRQVLCVVMDQGTEKWLWTFRWMLWLAPAGTPGRLKTGGVPPKPPATIFLSLRPSVFWDFGSLFRTLRRHFLTRCFGSRFIVTSLRRLRLGVAAQASGTSLSDVSAIPDVAAPRITRRRATAKSTLFYMQGSGCEINASHKQGSGCEINASHTQGSGCEINASLSIRRRLHVMARPRASRSSSYRDKRWEGVGFDMACCNVSSTVWQFQWPSEGLASKKECRLVQSDLLQGPEVSLRCGSIHVKL